jgi:dienelactone hydrolase
VTSHQWQLERDFVRFNHSATVSAMDGDLTISHPVFHAGTGPPLLLMHELPGLAQPCVDFAGRLIEQGFHVFAPHLVGPILRKAPFGNSIRLCVSREFAYLHAGVSAPITDWLRSLARQISTTHSAQRIGAIGMCLTGAFVVPLLIEPSVQAAVASQPSIPFKLLRLSLGKRFANGDWASQLNVSDSDLTAAAERSRSQGKALVVQRFTADRLCPRERVVRLAEAFAGCVDSLEYETSPRRGAALLPPHALLTEEFDRSHPAGTATTTADPTDRALTQLVAFFRRHLAPAPCEPQS